MSNCGSLGLSSEGVCLCLCVQDCVQGHRPSPLQSVPSSVVSSGHSSCCPHFPSCWSCSPIFQALTPTPHPNRETTTQGRNQGTSLHGDVGFLLSYLPGALKELPQECLRATSEEGREEGGTLGKDGDWVGTFTEQWT